MSAELYGIEQEQDLAGYSSMATGDLVTDIMQRIDALEAAKKLVENEAKEAREIQAELARRGLKMEFDSLKVGADIVTVHPEIPSPGLTETIPEEFDEVSQISVREPLDNRSVAEIRKEAVVSAAEAANDSASLQEFSGREYSKAIQTMMGIKY